MKVSAQLIMVFSISKPGYTIIQNNVSDWCRIEGINYNTTSFKTLVIARLVLQNALNEAPKYTALTMGCTSSNVRVWTVLPADVTLIHRIMIEQGDQTSPELESEYSAILFSSHTRIYNMHNVCYCAFFFVKVSLITHRIWTYAFNHYFSVQSIMNSSDYANSS